MSQVFGSNFIQQRIEGEIEGGLDPGALTLRFPPEPNGYLHIGHARAICLNFSLARRYGGRCFLRLDDTNPTTEGQHFVDQIMRDVRWLGFDWDAVHYTSDYFPRLYDYTVELIDKGLAYVDDQSPAQVRQSRGSLTQPGRASPWRERSGKENLDLLRAMREGRCPGGTRVVRARIDMSADNLNMRDPVIWRQCSDPHYRLGTEWKIFPLYDFSHCLADAIEGITHSLCTLEFADHRPLYDWFLEHLVDKPRPQQIEYARMNINGILTSKRRIRLLCKEGRVSGFDDPRLMTLAGLRQRGFTPEIIRDFCYRTPISRAQGNLETDYLYSVARETMNKNTPRAMAVLKPLKVILENLDPDQSIDCHSPIYPQRADGPKRPLRLSREIYVERDDFCEQPGKKFHRLAPGRSVRLRSAGVIHCLSVCKDKRGNITEVVCRYEANSQGARVDDQGNRVRATLHWVEAAGAARATVQMVPETPVTEKSPQTPPGDSGAGRENETDTVEIAGMEVLDACRVEAGLAQAPAGAHYQFERLGYFRCLGEDTWIRTLSLRSQT